MPSAFPPLHKIRAAGRLPLKQVLVVLRRACQDLLDGELYPREPVGVEVRDGVLLRHRAEGDAVLLHDAQRADVLGVLDHAEGRVHKIPCVAPALAVFLEEGRGLLVLPLDVCAAAVVFRFEDVAPVVAGIPRREAEPDLDAPRAHGQAVGALHDLHADRGDGGRHLRGQSVLRRDEKRERGRVDQLVGVGGVGRAVVGELELHHRADGGVQPLPDDLDAIDYGHGCTSFTWSRSGRARWWRRPCPRSSR